MLTVDCASRPNCKASQAAELKLHGGEVNNSSASFPFPSFSRLHLSTATSQFRWKICTEFNEIRQTFSHIDLLQPPASHIFVKSSQYSSTLGFDGGHAAPDPSQYCSRRHSAALRHLLNSKHRHTESAALDLSGPSIPLLALPQVVPTSYHSMGESTSKLSHITPQNLIPFTKCQISPLNLAIPPQLNSPTRVHFKVNYPL